MRPLQKALRALGTTILTLVVLGGITYGGYKAKEAKTGGNKAEVCLCMCSGMRTPGFMLVL
jgi:hypothetical protein